MSAYLFCAAIAEGRPISIFNNGDMRRDFTYVDDIVSGVVGVLDNPPPVVEGSPPYRLYNIGNHRSEGLMDFISHIEKAMGKKAEYRFEPMQMGDVKETYADISAIERDVGVHPTTTIAEGIPQFVNWYRSYHGV